MPGARELRDIQPLMALMNGAGEDGGQALSGLLVQGRLTVNALEEHHRIPWDENVFLVAHAMSTGTPYHRHDYWEIAYVLRGRVINRIEGHETYLVKNTACLMDEETEHALGVVEPDAIICNVCLRNALFAAGPFARFVREDNPVSRFMRGESESPWVVVTDTDNNEIQVAMANLIRVYAAGGYRDTLEVEAWAMLLLCALSKADSYTYTGMDARTIQMLDFIEANSATVTVGSLARAFGLTENYVTQYIRRSTGKRCSQFIIEAKLTHALELLRETDASVEAIAHEVGYASYSQFHKAFCRRFGETPRTYRLRAR